MADEYISREAALKYIKSEQCRTCSDIGLCGNCAVLVAVKLLEKVPAADVAEVVRCKNCKWFADNNGGEWYGCQLPRKTHRNLTIFAAMENIRQIREA